MSLLEFSKSNRIRSFANRAPRWPFELNRNSPQARNLVGWWPDGSNGTQLIELAGRGHAVTGVIPGKPASVTVSPTPTGVLAATFPGGTTAEIELGEWDDQLSGVSEYTVTMSVIARSLNFGGFDGLLCRGPNNVRSPWIFGQNSAASINFQSENSGGGNSTATGGTLVQDKIHYLAFVWQASTRQEIWIDNAIVATAASPHAGTIGVVSNADEARLGKTPGLASWDGQIWDVRLYNRALGGAEIRRINAPATRWDLYHELGRVKYYFVPSIVFTSANLALHHSGASDIGGAIGVILTDDQLNNLWDDVSSGDAGAGDTEYRCAYVKNDHGSLSTTNAKVEILTDPTESNFEIGLGAAGKNGTETAIANEDTAPGGVSFGTAPINLGTLAAGDFYPIWVKRIVTAGAGAATPDSGVLRISGDDPN